MDNSDAKIASLTARLVDPIRDENHSDMDEDEIFAQLEEEIENGSGALSREQGIERLKREMEQLQQMKTDGHGRYTEISDEKEVIHMSAKEPRCVIHFYHSNFKRCEIMDKHLARLAPKYFSTLFIRVFVESVPWLVEKLGIKVLPCVITFIKGVSTDRIIGFEDLGGVDSFETATLEWKLLNSGVIRREDTGSPSVTYGTRTAVRQRIRGTHDDDGSDFDIDD